MNHNKYKTLKTQTIIQMSFNRRMAKANQCSPMMEWIKQSMLFTHRTTWILITKASCGSQLLRVLRMHTYTGPSVQTAQQQAKTRHTAFHTYLIFHGKKSISSDALKCKGLYNWPFLHYKHIKYLQVTQKNQVEQHVSSTVLDIAV